MKEPMSARGPVPGASDEQAFDLLRELEQNTPDEIRRQRTHFRVTVKAKVILQPGNASDLTKLKLQGVTGDLSESGCRVLFPLPIGVGDIFRLTFDRTVLNLPVTFARCMRCHMLREDAYEAGFRFFTLVSLPETLAEEAVVS